MEIYTICVGQFGVWEESRTGNGRGCKRKPCVGAYKCVLNHLSLSEYNVFVKICVTRIKLEFQSLPCMALCGRVGAIIQLVTEE